MVARRIQLTTLGLMCLALSTTATPEAQNQKGKPPTSPAIAGSAVINCAGPADGTADAVCGDGNDVYVDGTLAGGAAGVQVHLREGDHQFTLRFDPAGAPARSLTAFVPDRLMPLLSFECVTNCLAANDGGNPISNAAVTVQVRNGQDARIQTTMRDAQGNAISGGPTAIAVGHSAPIDVLIGFQDPNGYGYRWGFYWSPVNYPGSTPATITRVGTCTWEVEAVPGDVVGLRLFNTGKGQNSTRSEGRFSMPFKVTFTADPTRMPGGCS